MTAIEAIDNLPDEVQAIVDAAARLNSQQRHALERALSDIDGLNPLTDPATSRRRRIGLVVTTLSCLGLAAWVGVLNVSLPAEFVAHQWRVAWIGFDVALLVALGATAWAAWGRRQLLIVFALVTATLMVCDAWFDVTLSWGSSESALSIFTAVCGELPAATIMLSGACHLIRLTISGVYSRTGVELSKISLWRVPLFLDNDHDAVTARPSAPPRSRPSRRGRSYTGS